MFFSVGYFILGILNLIYKDPDATYDFFNFLVNYHIFEISLVVGLVFSVRKNYQRAKTRTSKILSKMSFLVGLDFIFMLLGVFASQLILLSFTYSQDYNLHLMAGAYGIAVIIVNGCRKPFLEFLAFRIP